MLQRKIHKFLSGQYSKKEDSNQLKLLYIPSYSPAHGEFENLCFVSVASMVCMSRAFVYDAVNVNKIVIVFSTKPLSYPYVQVSTGLTLYLG